MSEITWGFMGAYKYMPMSTIEAIEEKTAILRVSPDIDISAFYDDYDTINKCRLSWDSLIPVNLYHSFDNGLNWNDTVNGDLIIDNMDQINDNQVINFRYLIGRNISNLYNEESLPVIRIYITLFSDNGEEWEKYYIFK